MKNVVEMHGMTKAFPGVLAVDNANFELREGEIHALIGENGAGKSTMMKMLYGLYEPDEGDIRIKGYDFKSLSPKEAIDLGVGMVHQEFMLLENMTVLENIILGFEPRLNKFRVDFQESRELVQYYVDTYGLDIQLDKKVKDISVGEAQRVEIIKTLYRGADILILDEPTAVLTPQETEKLFEILKKIVENNQSIIFISHKLDEIMELCDRVTVMRNGKYINTRNISEVNPSIIARDMVGREVFLNSKYQKGNPSDKNVLEIKNIFVPGDRELSKIRDLSFELKPGEILGVAGVDGNGQSELVEAITGLRKVEKGSVSINGEVITNKSPNYIRKVGITHIPEDRNRRGLNRQLTIWENLVATNLHSQNFFKHGVINSDNSIAYSEKLIEEYDIRPNKPHISTANLSGGNAQKIVIAREIDNAKEVLIASHPTRGVDVGSIEFIHKSIIKARDNGLAVLLISADLGEIMSLSDRIIVMYSGEIMGELENEEANETNLGVMMAGGKHEEI